MSKNEEKPYLEERYVQRFEERKGLLSQEKFIEELRELESLPLFFAKLLVSYRLAARVANAAWRYVELSEKEPDNKAILQCAFEDFESALAKYAPAHFKQPLMERLHIAEILENLFNQVSESTSLEQMREILYQATSEAQERAAEVQ